MKEIFESWRKFLREEEKDIERSLENPNDPMTKKEPDTLKDPAKEPPKKKERRTSGDIFKPQRGQEIKFDPNADPDLKYELYDLIKTAYAEIGGHAKISSPDQVLSDPDWNVWVGMDIHNDPDFDIVSFGSTTPFGIKFSGVGHDGTPEAKNIYKNLRVNDLQQDGNYVEASGKLARALIKSGVPIINDRETVEKVLGKKVKWLGKILSDEKALGDGWYVRTIGGVEHPKILLGKPGL